MEKSTETKCQKLLSAMGKLDDSKASHWQFCVLKLLEYPQYKDQTYNAIINSVDGLGKLSEVDLGGAGFQSLVHLWGALMERSGGSDAEKLSEMFSKIKPKFSHVQTKVLEKFYRSSEARSAEISMDALMKVAKSWGGRKLVEEFGSRIMGTTLARAVLYPQTTQALVKLFGYVNKNATVELDEVDRTWIGAWEHLTNDIVWKTEPQERDAVMRNASHVLDTLLDLGAEMDGKDSEGYSALERVGMRYFEEIEADRYMLGELVIRGADWQQLLDDMITKTTLEHPIVCAARTRYGLEEVVRKSAKSSKPRRAKPAM